MSEKDRAKGFFIYRIHFVRIIYAVFGSFMLPLVIVLRMAETFNFDIALAAHALCSFEV